MKKIKLLIPVFTVVSSVTMFTPLLLSCGNGNIPEEIKCKLTFTAGAHGHLEGETTLEIDKDTLWKDVTKPTPKNDSGYEFDGWYYNDIKLDDDPTYKIQSDMNIQARFKEIHVEGLFLVVDGVLKGFNPLLSQSDIDEELADETALPIPEGVTSIGDHAFDSSWTYRTIPNNIVSIDWSESPEIESINYDAFYGCTGLTKVEVPNSVTYIGPTAFSNCTGLTSFTFPDNLTSVGIHALRGCTSLTELVIGNYNGAFPDDSWEDLPIKKLVVHKGKVRDFSGIITLTNVTLSEGVVEIGDGAFAGCTNLPSIIIPNTVTKISTSAFSGCTNLQSINIPDSVIEIGGGAFSQCTNLLSITIPNSVTSIGGSTFWKCSKLQSINLGNGITTLYEHTFEYCTSLQSITIPNSVKTIGNHVFYGCTGLTNIDIPNSVITIGNYAFSDCTGLTSINIPNSVTSIGSYLFKGCTKLTSITIPESVTNIDDAALRDCPSLKELVIDDYKETFSHPIWSQLSIEKLVVNKGVVCDFFDINTIKNIVLGDNVTGIGNKAFSGCSGLTGVNLGNGVKTIGDNAFSSCTSLPSISIPNSVLSIGKEAFSGCTSLPSITIPNSVTSIGDDAFFSLSELEINNYKETFTKNAWRMLHSLKKLIVHSGNVRDFPNMNGLENVTLGDNGITQVGDEAFLGCKKLTNVNLGNGVTSIGASAFKNCTGLTSLAIPNSVVSIGTLAFNGSLLSQITYDGYKDDWNKIEKGADWHPYSTVVIHCKDGDITI